MKTKRISEIKGFEEYSDYSVTSDGDIISHKREKDLILKGEVLHNGYLRVSLCSNGGYKRVRIHTLVALAFCKGYSNNLEVNHFDEDKKNNNYKNLEWLTHKENINHGTGRKRHDKAISKPVAQLTLDGKLVKIWDSMMKAQRDGGFSQSSISKACSGKAKTHAGFNWELTLESEVR
jgi:hypothetical protein